jgi:hypothetical protein
MEAVENESPMTFVGENGIEGIESAQVEVSLRIFRIVASDAVVVNEWQDLAVKTFLKLLLELGGAR